MMSVSIWPMLHRSQRADVMNNRTRQRVTYFHVEFEQASFGRFESLERGPHASGNEIPKSAHHRMMFADWRLPRTTP